MARQRFIDLVGTIGVGGVTNVAVTHTFTAPLTYLGGVTVPSVSGSDNLIVTILNAAGTDVAEVWKITAYNHTTGLCSMVRAQEGTTAVAHVSGTTVIQGSYPSDFDQGIDRLSDVDTSTVAPVNGDRLAYNSTTGVWAPSAAPLHPFLLMGA